MFHIGPPATIFEATLVVRGERSNHLRPATVQRMTDEVMTNARAIEVAGAGHNVMLDQPEALGQVLADFLLGASGSE